MSNLELIAIIYLLPLLFMFHTGMRLQKEGWECMVSASMLDTAKSQDPSVFNDHNSTGRAVKVLAFIPVANAVFSILVLGLMASKE